MRCLIIQFQYLTTDMQTPKAKPDPEFTSPIGLLDKHSSSNINRHGQSNQLRSNQVPSNRKNEHEQQFFRIKSQRLDGQLLEYQQENRTLRAKLIDANASNQILREKVYSLENYRPAKPVSSQETNSNNSEIERLLKEIRVLKNEHEFQMAKQRDENRKLQRNILQLKTQTFTKHEQQTPSKEREIFTNNQQLQQQNQKLREQIQQQTQLITQHESSIKNLVQHQKTYAKEKLEFDAMAADRNQCQHRYEILLKQYEDQCSKFSLIIKQNNELLQLKNEKLGNSRTELSEINENQLSFKEVEADRKQIEQPQQTDCKENHQSGSDQSPKVRLLALKLHQKQAEISQKNEEISNLLIKLKPLLSSSNKFVPEPEPSTRASLSLLQVFLKKYKISMF